MARAWQGALTNRAAGGRKGGAVGRTTRDEAAPLLQAPRSPDRAEPTPGEPEPAPVEHHVVEIDTDQLRQLSNVFSAPKWLRDLGLASWLLAGVALLLVGIVWLAAATATIVDPVVAGLIVATVASPVVGWLGEHRIPRAGGAAIVLLGIIVIVLVLVLLVVGGITSQIDEIKAQAEAAAPKAQSWLDGPRDELRGRERHDRRDRASRPRRNRHAGPRARRRDLVARVGRVPALVPGLAIFFLLKDGPGMRRWVDGHMGVAAHRRPRDHRQRA